MVTLEELQLKGFFLQIKCFPENIEENGEGAFNECICFTELIIPSSMIIINKKAFKECTEQRCGHGEVK